MSRSTVFNIVQVVQRALKKYRSQVNLQKNKHKFGKVKKEEEEDMGDGKLQPCTALFNRISGILYSDYNFTLPSSMFPLVLT